ncbi:MAG: hypothetical protein M0P74_14900 [Syntrophales bacterium]|jgi:hypothetical protein|nr:hypothetical protein [Syntrophales bacterium]
MDETASRKSEIERFFSALQAKRKSFDDLMKLYEPVLALHFFKFSDDIPPRYYVKILLTSNSLLLILSITKANWQFIDIFSTNRERGLTSDEIRKKRRLHEPKMEIEIVKGTVKNQKALKTMNLRSNPISMNTYPFSRRE